MSLADVIIPTREVALGEYRTSVRGISLNDVSALLRDHLAELSSLFDMYDNEETRETAMAASASFAIRLVQEAPDMVATAIVLLTDSPESDLAKARKFPLGWQVELIRVALEVTFEEAGGAKKFLDKMMAMVRSVRPKTKALG